jgi:tRNA (guanine-N7-)-methyltransferase
VQQRNKTKDERYARSLIKMLNQPFPLHPRRIRSFVCRNSRETQAQHSAYEKWWPKFGISPTKTPLNMPIIFGQSQPVFLEIGFGMGQSLLACAKQNPDKNFIGVETHRPGIGALLQGIEKEEINNIRIYHGDAVDFLQMEIQDHSLSGVHIFFPDPWQKRRHFSRRLIQSEFVSLLVSKCKVGGRLHLATDWSDYAKQMMMVLEQEAKLKNTMTSFEFSPRSPYRPILSKFERRALKEGRSIWELQFVVV